MSLFLLVTDVLNIAKSIFLHLKGSKHAFLTALVLIKSLILRNLCFSGGPSGSGKTSLAHKMANIIGCEVVSLESYYKQVKDFKYDDFSALDLSLLSKVR